MNQAGNEAIRAGPVMRPGFTSFLSTESQPRVRQASDAVIAATGLLLASWGIYGADRLSPFEQALQDLIRFPGMQAEIARVFEKLIVSTSSLGTRTTVWLPRPCNKQYHTSRRDVCVTLWLRESSL